MKVSNIGKVELLLTDGIKILHIDRMMVLHIDESGYFLII